MADYEYEDQEQFIEGEIIPESDDDPHHQPRVFSSLLLAYRGRTGLSQHEILEVVDTHIDQPQWARWETGEHRPTRKSVDEIARILASIIRDTPQKTIFDRLWAARNFKQDPTGLPEAVAILADRMALLPTKRMVRLAEHFHRLLDLEEAIIEDR